jgi:hypothetical protein
MDIQTYTGKRIDPMRMKIEDIELLDIAHSLSMVCRFGGHCSRHYSVAEHSMLVESILHGPPEAKLYALLHDAAEAFIGDAIIPLKVILRVGDSHFSHLEEQCLRIILMALGVPYPDEATRQVVHTADMIALATERRDLLVNTGAHWPCLDGMLPLEHYKLDAFKSPAPDVLRYSFMVTYEELREKLR